MNNTKQPPPEVLEAVTLAKTMKRQELDGDYPFNDVLQCELTRYADDFSVLMWPNAPRGQDEFLNGVNSKEHLLHLISRAVPALAIDKVVFLSDGFALDAPKGDYGELQERLKRDFGGSMQAAWSAGRQAEFGIVEAMLIFIANRNETKAGFVDMMTAALPYEIYGRKHPKKIEWKELEYHDNAVGRIADVLTYAFSRQDLLTFAMGDEPVDDPEIRLLRAFMRVNGGQLTPEERRYHADVASTATIMEDGAIMALGSTDPERTARFATSLEAYGLSAEEMPK